MKNDEINKYKLLIDMTEDVDEQQFREYGY